MNVELKPHVGTKDTKRGPVQVTIPQDRIFVDGVLAGYVSHKPGSLVRLILSSFTDEELQEIKSKVDALRGSESKSIHQIPNIQECTFQVVVEQKEETELDI